MDNNDIKITFVLPIYNTNIDYLKKCIESITNQKVKEYEMLLINDGSTNLEIEKICKDYSKKYKNIIYIYQENSGVSVARNVGIKNARGTYIFFIDPDDELKEDFFEKFKVSEKEESDIIIFDYSFFYTKEEKIETLKSYKDISNEKKDIIANIMFNPFKFNNFILGSIWAKCFKRIFLQENNLYFDKNLRKAQDRIFMLYATDKAKTIKYYPIYCYKYRVNEESICHKQNKKMQDYYLNFYNAAILFFKQTNYTNEQRKYLEYSIINELLPLDIFNIKNTDNMNTKKKKLNKLYKIFNLDEALKKIKLRDIKSIKGKIKLILFKMKLFWLLNKIFLLKQKNIEKEIFKERKNCKC